MKLVYVAGPYSAPDAEGVELNVAHALDVADRLEDSGAIVTFIPHLSHYRHARKPRPYEEWMRLDEAWLRQCDAMFRISRPSSGAAREEVVMAVELRRPIFFSEEECIAWATR